MGLTVTEISCRRGGRLVLDGVSLSAPFGAARVLLGPNGAGKSSLLRAIAGLLPSDGEIGLDGCESAEDVQAQIAYCGHLDAIKPALSVMENLSFWSAYLGGTQAAVETALERFALTKLASRPAHMCSAGQKKRLGLARLLLAHRPVWLLDEPLVSLDTDTIAVVETVLRDHLSAGGIALVATHQALDVPHEVVRLTPPTARARSDFLDGAFA